MTDDAGRDERLDRFVGRVAGAIYTDAIAQLSIPPLMLVPAITFKVRKILEDVTDIDLLSEDQKEKLAQDIRISVVPMLFTFEIEPEIIERIVPTIESSVVRSFADPSRSAPVPLKEKEKP